MDLTNINLSSMSTTPQPGSNVGTGGEIGAGVGSVVPGVGTVIGGLFGSLVGGLVKGATPSPTQATQNAHTIMNPILYRMNPVLVTGFDSNQGNEATANWMDTFRNNLSNDALLAVKDKNRLTLADINTMNSAYDAMGITNLNSTPFVQNLKQGIAGVVDNVGTTGNNLVKTTAATTKAIASITSSPLLALGLIAAFAYLFLKE